MTYLEDGRCSFSNNLSENCIRPFVVGRKGWLFCDTPVGAQASAMAYTMVEMAKANKVNVYHYLTFLFEHQPNDQMTDEELEQLAPWNKTVKAEIQRRVDSQNNEQRPAIVKSYVNCQGASVAKPNWGIFVVVKIYLQVDKCPSVCNSPKLSAYTQITENQADMEKLIFTISS